MIDPADAQNPHSFEEKRLLATIQDGWTASLYTGNRKSELTHSFPAVRTDRVRFIWRKGAFGEPQFVRISKIAMFFQGVSVGGDAEVRASSGENAELVLDENPLTIWQNSTPMRLWESQFLELTFPRKAWIDRIEIVTDPSSPVREYRLECWQNGWWRNLTTAVLHCEPELIRPIAYPQEMLDRPVPVELSDWRTWGLLSENFVGSVDYENEFELKETEKVFLDLGDVGQSAQVYVNGQYVGTRIMPPFVFELSDKACLGKNHLRVRISNAIAQNISACKNPCGLLGDVRVLKLK